MQSPETNDTWFIYREGLDLEADHHEHLYRGQVLEFAVRAYTILSIPSDEREIRHLLRADYTYDINAKILCVTRFDGGQEPDTYLTIVDFGLKAYSFEHLEDGVLEAGNYWVSAKIWLTPMRLGPGGRAAFPHASELNRKWRIENIYRCNPQSGYTPDLLHELPEFRLAGFDTTEEDFAKGISKIQHLCLRVKDLGPALSIPN